MSSHLRCVRRNFRRSGGYAGVLADGGLTIFKAANYEEALTIAHADPTVQSGILNVEVKTFWVRFHP